MRPGLAVVRVRVREVVAERRRRFAHSAHTRLGFSTREPRRRTRLEASRRRDARRRHLQTAPPRASQALAARVKPLRERAPRLRLRPSVQPEPAHEPPQAELAQPLPRVRVALGEGALVALRRVAPVSDLRAQGVAFGAKPPELGLGVRAPQRQRDRVVQLVVVVVVVAMMARHRGRGERVTRVRRRIASRHRRRHRGGLTRGGIDEGRRSPGQELGRRHGDGRCAPLLQR